MIIYQEKNGVEYKIPNSYDELTRGQAFRLLGIISKPLLPKEMIANAIALLAPLDKLAKTVGKELLDIWKEAKKNAQSADIPPTKKQLTCAAFAPHFTWIFAPIFNKNVLEYLEIDGAKYLIPDPKLANVPTIQWHNAAQYLWAYEKTKEAAHLHSFLAYLLTQEGKPFEEKKAQYLAQKIGKFPAGVIKAFALYASKQANLLFEDYQELFGKSTTDAPPDYSEIMFIASESGVFGDLDKVGAQPLSTILFWLKRETLKSKTS